jgi:hypothetical protein
MTSYPDAADPQGGRRRLTIADLLSECQILQPCLNGLFAIMAADFGRHSGDEGADQHG